MRGKKRKVLRSNVLKLRKSYIWLSVDIPVTKSMNVRAIVRKCGELSTKYEVNVESK